MNAEAQAKISSYIGFAARARKIIYGVDQITARVRKQKLIVMCGTAGENTKKQIIAYVEKTSSPLVVLDGVTIEDILKKNNCKAIAVTDENLAKAIINYCNA